MWGNPLFVLKSEFSNLPSAEVISLRCIIFIYILTLLMDRRQEVEGCNLIARDMRELSLDLLGCNFVCEILSEILLSQLYLHT